MSSSCLTCNQQIWWTMDRDLESDWVKLHTVEGRSTSVYFVNIWDVQTRRCWSLLWVKENLHDLRRRFHWETLRWRRGDEHEQEALRCRFVLCHFVNGFHPKETTCWLQSGQIKVKCVHLFSNAVFYLHSPKTGDHKDHRAAHRGSQQRRLWGLRVSTPPVLHHRGIYYIYRRRL